MRRVLAGVAVAAGLVLLSGCLTSTSDVIAGAPLQSTFPAGTPLTVVLDAQGLGFYPTSAGTSPAESAVEHLSFSASTDTDVVAELSNAFGDATVTQAPDCSGGPLDQVVVGGFNVFFNESRFVGWSYTGMTSPALTTKDALGIGTPLSQLQMLAPSVVVATTADGASWSTPTGGLSGKLAGTDASSGITELDAGTTCSAQIVTSPSSAPVSS